MRNTLIILFVGILTIGLSFSTSGCGDLTPKSYTGTPTVAGTKGDWGKVEWAKSVGGAPDYDQILDDRGEAVAATSDGSVYVTGCFEGSALFGDGHTLTSIGANPDCFLTKYDEDGEVQWVRHIGSTNMAWGRSVCALERGDVFVAGTFSGSATFGLGETSETTLVADGGTDIFIAMYDSDGLLIWAKRAGGTMSDRAMAVAAAPDGAVVIVGSFQDEAVFGSGESNEITLTSKYSEAFDIFIARYDGADGSLVWANNRTTSFSSEAKGVKMLSDGSIFITGYFYTTVTFDPENANVVLTSAGNADVFIARFNGDGSLAWAKRAGGTGGDMSFDISLLPGGSTYITGYFAGAATFGAGDPGETDLTSSGITDAFLARYDSDGTIEWVKAVGGSGFASGRGVSTDSNGTVFIGGMFKETIILEGVVGSKGTPGTVQFSSAGGLEGLDGFVARFTSEGLCEWARRAGGSSDCRINQVAVVDGSNGSIYVTGYWGARRSSTTASFAPSGSSPITLISQGYYDMFVAKYTQ